jgi:hypothetical protein
MSKKMNVEWLDRALVIGPYLTLVLSEKQFKKVMKHCNIADAPSWLNYGADATTHHFVQDTKSLSVVALKVTKKFSPEQIMGLIVHEAVHVWQNFRDSIGEEKPSVEFEAYSIQSITQALITYYNETKNG